MNEYILVGGYIIDEVNQKRYTNIHIKDERIESLNPDMADEIDKVDITDKLITLGLVDMHVHLRYPGQTHKEDLQTGTAAALKGGYTNIYAMPNVKPIIDNVELLTKINSKTAKLPLKINHYASITKNLSSDELTDMKELETYCAGFSNDGMGVQKSSVMYEAMMIAKKLDKMIVAHVEDQSLVYGGVIHEGLQSTKLGLKGIMSASEYVQLSRDLDLCELTGAKYHMCHISTSQTVDKIEVAKKNNLNITCEVTPHHLLLVDTDVIDSNYKMNPPLRAKEDREALIKGIQDGVIDVIATDHAPHSNEEKDCQISKAPFGIIGLEHAFSLCYTYLVQEDIITLHKLIELMSINPRKIMGLTSKLEVGISADLAIIDLEQMHEITEDNIVSKSKNTPFIGRTIKGLTKYVIVDGRVVYENV